MNWLLAASSSGKATVYLFFIVLLLLADLLVCVEGLEAICVLVGLDR
jgi:hypothetical protein